jgi:hypothetical protein
VGILRSLQFVATLVVAGPVAMVGVLNLIEGRHAQGAFFLAAALGLLVVSEFVYVRVTAGTVGRVRRLKHYRPWRRGGDGDERSEE